MSFKSNQRVIWNLVGGDPNGNRVGSPGDLLWDETAEILWVKAYGRQTNLGWRAMSLSSAGVTALAETIAVATLLTDGAGGFTTLRTTGFSSVVLVAPRDVIFAFTTPPAGADYQVVAMGAEGTGGLFINCPLADRNVNTFHLDLFDNSNANVNPLTAVVTLDVVVTRRVD
jgi:hypothetical protein